MKDLTNVKYISVSLILITLAEVFLFERKIMLCITFHGFNLIYIIYLSLFNKKVANKVIPLLLPSTFRLANLAMPVFLLLRMYQLAIIYIVIFPAVYFVAKALNMSGEDLGFTSNYWYLIFPAIIIGIFLGKIESQFIKFSFKTQPIVVLIVMFTFVALGEELMYRSIIQGYLEKDFGIWSVFISAYVNAIMISNANLIIFTFIVALLLGFIFEKTKNIWIDVFLHGAICAAFLLL